MDLVQNKSELQERNNSSKKMILWFSLISLFMAFAGLTSAVIISRSRPDWAEPIALPSAFTFSLIAIIMSSICLILAKKTLKKDNYNATTLFLLGSFILGIVFVFLQFLGFNQFINTGLYFTGKSSNPKVSFIFLIAFFHIIHVAVGLISLLVVIYNHFKQKYSASNTLGVDLLSIFWHFIGILWVYLFILFSFIN